MTDNAADIEQIVRSVMREMQFRVSPESVGTSVGHKSVTDGGGSDTLRISGRVVSENVLIESQASGRTVSLMPGAIITPSGRDYIRRNNIRVSSDINGRSAEATLGTLVVVGKNSVAESAAVTAGWKTLAATTEFEAASLASAHLADGVVACSGGEPSVVACLLNRNTLVRAAVVTRATNLMTLASVMNPQVICLDSSAWPFGDLLKLLRGLTAAGLRTVPADWRELSAGGVR